MKYFLYYQYLKCFLNHFSLSLLCNFFFFYKEWPELLSLAMSPVICYLLSKGMNDITWLSHLSFSENACEYFPVVSCCQTLNLSIFMSSYFFSWVNCKKNAENCSWHKWCRLTEVMVVDKVLLLSYSDFPFFIYELEELMIQNVLIVKLIQNTSGT